MTRQYHHNMTPEQLKARAVKAAKARTTIEYHINTLLERKHDLTDEHRARIRLLFRNSKVTP